MPEPDSVPKPRTGMTRHTDGNDEMQRVWTQYFNHCKDLPELWVRIQIDQSIPFVNRKGTDFTGGCAVAAVVLETVLAGSSECVVRLADQPLESWSNPDRIQPASTRDFHFRLPKGKVFVIQVVNSNRATSAQLRPCRHHSATTVES